VKALPILEKRKETAAEIRRPTVGKERDRMEERREDLKGTRIAGRKERRGEKEFPFSGN